MTEESIRKQLVDLLFKTDDTNAYAVLDGASVDNLLPALAEHRPESACLYWGELAPDLAAAAPYLVHLQRNHSFTDWLLREGWGRHWGIVALCPANLDTTRRHFRTFLMVRNPEGKKLYFRYYDPRVLRVYLPTCNPREMEFVFGPVQTYVMEGESPDNILCFQRGPRGPQRRTQS